MQSPCPPSPLENIFNPLPLPSAKTQWSVITIIIIIDVAVHGEQGEAPFLAQ
jgi:hypothetical protein